ncbi:2-oxo-4-hydroxy-4-carboxy-5-ureidoimidazoline decarboxylase [Microbacterium sp. H1-D42]|uniref:2-oxo-4-hydroxy-4-carboxy-5-ureidoimidazoline decarboxylase n=1 Tax=Microbacterium sp. H1-D42 TaxID=2925844 RepID=UPI001F52DCDF|nr:2-oxo-4-hydroxy-4-carboxy-5-ureidoimidazoline decarboxylase [Microbacterium sp. H1-D42]UNK70951.1 2-oxo-4-hydroxy-4-carboxy-5-ureidoimidazoline decarboxylase [Microbacterium sp. H1-D42]
MLLEQFNRAERGDAVAALRPCVDVTRWCEHLADHRPYSSIDSLVAEAARAADPFTADEVASALAHHPRIGERAAGDSREAAMSRAEQSAVDPADADVQQQLREGNLAYEQRFGRVFLIRAAGRAPAEILSALRDRLHNGDDVEQRVVAEQLREIALLRLRGVVTS